MALFVWPGFRPGGLPPQNRGGSATRKRELTPALTDKQRHRPAAAGPARGGQHHDLRTARPTPGHQVRAHATLGVDGRVCDAGSAVLESY